MTTQTNITSATVLKAIPGTILLVSVVVAGSAAGTVNDCATTGAAAAANQTATIPATLGVYQLGIQHGLGIVIVPGTGQTLAASYQ
jgi:hypothetical protein